ncbi:hypothetical protein RI367_005641 [Sorochytrium milnesiophthora]
MSGETRVVAVPLVVPQPEDVSADGSIVLARPLNPAQHLIKNLGEIRARGLLAPKMDDAAISASVDATLSTLTDAHGDDKEDEQAAADEDRVKAYNAQRQAIADRLRSAVIDVASAIELVEFLLKPPLLPQLPPGQVLPDPPFWYKEIAATNFPQLVSRPVQSQLHDAEYGYGAKKQQIRQAAAHLLSHAHQLDSAVDAEFRFFAQQGVRLRGNGWRIRQRAIVPAGTTRALGAQGQLFIDYGYQLSGSTYKEHGYANIYRFSYATQDNLAAVDGNAIETEDAVLSPLVYIDIRHKRKRRVVLSLRRRGALLGEDWLSALEEHSAPPTIDDEILSSPADERAKKEDNGEDPVALHRRLASARENVFQAELFATLLEEAQAATTTGALPFVHVQVSTDHKINLTIDTSTQTVLTIELKAVQASQPVSVMHKEAAEAYQLLRQTGITMHQLLRRRHTTHQLRAQMSSASMAHSRPTTNPYARDIPSALRPPPGMLAHVAAVLVFQTHVKRADALLTQYVQALSSPFTVVPEPALQPDMHALTPATPTGPALPLPDATFQQALAFTPVRFSSHYDAAQDSPLSKTYRLQFGNSYFVIAVAAPAHIHITKHHLATISSAASAAPIAIELSGLSQLDALLQYEIEQQIVTSLRQRGTGDAPQERIRSNVVKVSWTPDVARDLQIHLHGILRAVSSCSSSD